MAYNKAREEKKWRLWKEAEEKQLRSLGVSESDIETLRVHDWAIFNSDRRYYQRMQETGTYLEEVATDMTQPEIKTVEDFLDNIENQQLYQVLIKVDRLTLRIAFMKVQGSPCHQHRACKKGLAFSLYGTSGSSYTLETREVLRLLHREFIYVGDPVPELNEQEHAAFLMNIQRSILLSLEKRKLLTHSQRERCLVELEKQYSREQKSRRRA